MCATNLSLPLWQAYRDLFAAVQSGNTWSRSQLVDKLNADAATQSLPKCTYSERSLVYWETERKRGKRSSKPRIYRMAHLHQWLAERIAELKQTDPYATRLAAIAPPVSQQRFTTQNKGSVVIPIESGTSVILATRKDTPQWADFREIDLVNKRFDSIECMIITSSPYFRFGFKLLASGVRLFGDGSIQAQDTNRVIHVGRNNWNRPNITHRDIFLTHYVNGVKQKYDQKIFTGSGRIKLAMKLKIDNAFSASFFVDGVCRLKQVIPPEICYRVVMLAWGDTEEYEVEVHNLVVSVV